MAVVVCHLGSETQFRELAGQVHLANIPRKWEKGATFCKSGQIVWHAWKSAWVAAQTENGGKFKGKLNLMQQSKIKLTWE